MVSLCELAPYSCCHLNFLRLSLMSVRRPFVENDGERILRYFCRISSQIFVKFFCRLIFSIKFKIMEVGWRHDIQCHDIQRRTLSIVTFSKMTVSTMTLSMMTVSTMTLSIMTLSTRTLSMMIVSSMTLSIMTVSQSVQ